MREERVAQEDTRGCGLQVGPGAPIWGAHADPGNSPPEEPGTGGVAQLRPPSYEGPRGGPQAWDHGGAPVPALALEMGSLSSALPSPQARGHCGQHGVATKV
jgi:hypothetical protein